MMQYAEQKTSDRLPMQKKTPSGENTSIAKVLQAFMKDASAMASRGSSVPLLESGMDTHSVQFQLEKGELFQSELETIKQIPNNAGIKHTLKAGVESGHGLSSDYSSGKKAVHDNNNIIQRKTEVLNVPQDYRYGTRICEVGKTMQAWLDPEDPLQGQSACINSAQNDMMSAIRIHYNIRGNNVVKGHLLNDNLGGTALNKNLYPITGAANKDHLNRVENTVKTMVWDGLPTYYEVVVFSDPNINEPCAEFHCTVQKWNKEEGDIGDTVLQQRITSNLCNSSSMMKTPITLNSKRAKRPPGIPKPKSRVSELSDEEIEMRTDDNTRSQNMPPSDLINSQNMPPYYFFSQNMYLSDYYVLLDDFMGNIWEEMINEIYQDSQIAEIINTFGVEDDEIYNAIFDHIFENGLDKQEITLIELVRFFFQTSYMEYTNDL